MKNIILTGIPRSGTTLCCSLLNSCDNTLALHEPLSPEDFSASDVPVAVCQQIVQFYLHTRLQVASTGTALSRHRNGVVPDNIIVEGEPALLPTSDSPNDDPPKENRSVDISHGDIDVSKQRLREDFILIVKHNALFTALLPELNSLLPVYGVVRNPLAVLVSWSRVDLPVNEGQLPAGEKFSSELRDKLSEENNVLQRQLIILNWICRQFRQYLSPNRILYYEDFSVDPQSLYRSLGIKFTARASGSSGSNKNGSATHLNVDNIYNALIKNEGDIWHFYTKAAVTELYEEITQ